jgi:nucleoside-diphosphate-sugar epimerase
MKILITGATGFIGSRLIRYLTSKNHNIVGLSRTTQNHEIKKISLTDKKKLNNFFKKNKFDVVIHLGSTLIENKPSQIFEENSISLINLLDCCRLNNIKKFIFASTHMIYETSHYLPIDENHPINPKGNYAITKLINENICKMYSSSYSLNIIILRIASVYGEGQSKNFLIPTLMKNCIKNNTMIIHKYKNGYQLMDLIHVNDVCKAINLACKSKIKFDIFNIASGSSMTALKIAQIFTEINSKYKIKNKIIRKNTNHFVYDMSKAKNKLKFKAQIQPSRQIIEPWFNRFINEQ